MKVKSMGQKKTTFHLPAKSLSVMSLNSLPFSRLTAALRWNAGNLSPTVSIACLAPSLSLGIGWLEVPEEAPDELFDAVRECKSQANHLLARTIRAQSHRDFGTSVFDRGVE